MKREDYGGLNRETFGDEYKTDENSYSKEMYGGSYNTYEAGAVSQYLLNGETVLWEGKGKAGIGANIIGIVFMVFWLGFAVFWTVSAMSASFTFGLFGIPFIVIGIVIVLKMRSYGGEKHYAITDKRLVIVSKKEVEAVFLDEIVSATISGRAVECSLTSMTRVHRNNDTDYASASIYIYTDDPAVPHKILCQAIADYRE